MADPNTPSTLKKLTLAAEPCHKAVALYLLILLLFLAGLDKPVFVWLSDRSGWIAAVLPAEICWLSTLISLKSEKLSLFESLMYLQCAK